MAFLPPGVIATAILLAFGRTLFYGLTNWDDNLNILTNPAVMNPSFIRIWRIWTQPYESLYVPLVYTSYVLDLLVWNGMAASLHFTNLLLHCLASISVYFLTLRLLGSPKSALLGALVFALHPLQVESVAWVTGRKDVLSGSMVLLSLWQFDRWLTTRRHSCYGWACLAFAAGLLAKPTAVVAPVLALTLALYRGRRLKELVAPLLPWFGVSLLFALVNMLVQSGAEGAPFVVPVWKRPFVAADSIMFYLRKLVVPVGLSPMYPRTTTTIFQSPLVWFELPIVLAAAAYLLRRRGPPALFAGWFVIPILPVLGFLPFYYQSFSNVADRYVYVSLAGVGGMVAWLHCGASSRFSQSRELVHAASFCMLTVLGILTFQQSRFWRDSETLWRRAVLYYPDNAAIHHNLAEALAEQKRRDEARVEFAKTLELDPNNPTVYVNLATMAQEEGNLDDALRLALLGVAGAPKLVDAQAALGEVYVSRKEFPEAEKAFGAALDLAPLSGHLMNRLGYVLVKNGKYPAAEEMLRKAVRQSPLDPLAHVNLGMALARQNRLSEAEECLLRAIDLEPGSEIARKMLGDVRSASRPRP